MPRPPRGGDNDNTYTGVRDNAAARRYCWLSVAHTFQDSTSTSSRPPRLQGRTTATSALQTLCVRSTPRCPIGSRFSSIGTLLGPVFLTGPAQNNLLWERRVAGRPRYPIDMDAEPRNRPVGLPRLVSRYCSLRLRVRRSTESTQNACEQPKRAMADMSIYCRVLRPTKTARCSRP